MITQEKALNRLKKIRLSHKLATYLVENGVMSVSQLALMPTPKLRVLLKDVDLNKDSIKSIKKRACALKAIIDNHAMTVHGQVSPYFKNFSPLYSRLNGLV